MKNDTWDTLQLDRPTEGQNRNHAAKNKKIDFFSFRLKLIPHYSKLFVDLSMYNVFCFMLKFKVTLCLKSGVFDDFA